MMVADVFVKSGENGKMYAGGFDDCKKARLPDLGYERLRRGAWEKYDKKEKKGVIFFIACEKDAETAKKTAERLYAKWRKKEHKILGEENAKELVLFKDYGASPPSRQGHMEGVKIFYKK